ncbi:hypothetical protein KKH05_03175 [Patescibacteria group bacterium]|nr:hypothetical protein [Patescibacteria group bacterium]
MLINPTQEEVEERIELVPENLWEIGMSEGVSDEIDKIATTLSLADEQKATLAKSIGLVFLGFINRSHFQEVIEAELHIPKDALIQLVDAVEKNIFHYVSQSLDEFYSSMNHSVAKPAEPTIPEKGVPLVHPRTIVEEPAEASAKPQEEIIINPAKEVPVASTPQEEVVIKPAIQREEPEMPASPFVLHEHEDVESISEGSGYTGGLARPSFYVEPDGGKSSEDIAPPLAARLELGKDSIETTQAEPARTKVGKENAQVIHYSTPEASADPFAKVPEPQPRPEEIPAKPKNKSAIHPSNVVNLKDLPK